MNWMDELRGYAPQSPQEAADRALMLELGAADPRGILTRESRLGHLTSSGFVVNSTLTKVLMAYHNIYQSWAWTGGHADGDPDLLAVALREAREETGIQVVEPLSPTLASVDILTVEGHQRRGVWVSAHVHLNFTYLLTAPEDQALRHQPDENQSVAWLPLDQLGRYCTEPKMLPVYHKLAQRARALGKKSRSASRDA